MPGSLTMHASGAGLHDLAEQLLSLHSCSSVNLAHISLQHLVPVAVWRPWDGHAVGCKVDLQRALPVSMTAASRQRTCMQTADACTLFHNPDAQAMDSQWENKCHRNCKSAKICMQIASQRGATHRARACHVVEQVVNGPAQQHHTSAQAARHPRRYSHWQLAPSSPPMQVRISTTCHDSLTLSAV